MKKSMMTLLLAVLMSANAHAQASDCEWAVNTRAWTTNYFSTLLWGVTKLAVTELVTSDEADSLLLERILPDASMVFPFGMKKEGFDDPNNIYGPYHHAFSNPFTRLGDFAIGVDVAWTPSVVGLYAGAYFKSQEIVFKETEENLRGFYFQPRAGLSLNFGDKRGSGIEGGVFYDVVTGCRADFPGADKKMLKGGLGLDFAVKLLSEKQKKNQFIIQLSLPLHNFLNKDYEGGAYKMMDRRVGYIMCTNRILL